MEDAHRCVRVGTILPALVALSAKFTAFHHREGIAISTVTYNDDGEVRPLFYRLSLAEMVVPYGAPEHPHPRKHAFDAYATKYNST